MPRRVVQWHPRTSLTDDTPGLDVADVQASCTVNRELPSDRTLIAFAGFGARCANLRALHARWRLAGLAVPPSGNPCAGSQRARFQSGACSFRRDLYSMKGQDRAMPSEAEARKTRAAARRALMTVEVVAFGERKPSPYAKSTPDERLAAAVRLIDHHQALRGGYSTLPRAAWPGEAVKAGAERG